MPAELDPHILAQMTEEERSAIEEKHTPEEIAAIAAIANGSEDDDDEDEDDDAGAAAATATAATAATDAAKTDPDPTATPAKSDAAPAATEAEADNSFTPTYQSKLPDDFEAQVTAIKDQSDALVAKFKGGEMDFDQYRIEAEALAKSERALDAVALKASLSQEMSAQTAEQQWNHTVSRFMSTAAKAEVGAIDYRTDTAKNKDLDLFVKSLAQDTANSDKPAEWFLTEAHKRVLALHGIGLVQAPANTDPKATRKPNLSSVPKTLAQVPGGDGPGDVDGNEFSDIDRLKGDEQEAAIAKMTPAQRERYMASA